MPHFMGVEFARQAGLPMNHVPYRGGAPVMTDVLAGVITAGMNVLSEPTPFHLGGQMRILAVSAPQRIPRLPDVPTFAELGFPALTKQEWFGVLLPAGSPAGVVQPLHAALAAAAATRRGARRADQAGIRARDHGARRLRRAHPHRARGMGADRRGFGLQAGGGVRNADSAAAFSWGPALSAAMPA